MSAQGTSYYWESNKRIMQKGEFSGRRTNHSCRATTATCMYEQGADEQLICEKTGHQSVAVRSYKRTSNRQLKQVSDILCGNIDDKDVKPNKIAKLEPTSTVSVPWIDSESNSSTGVMNPVTVTKNESDMSHSVEIGKGITLNININVPKWTGQVSLPVPQWYCLIFTLKCLRSSPKGCWSELWNY